MSPKSTKFVASNGFKAYVSAARRKVFEAAPARIECPKCESERVKKAFGVRTFKDSTGKPVRFGMQSYCTPCRNGKKPTKRKIGGKKSAKIGGSSPTVQATQVAF